MTPRPSPHQRLGADRVEVQAARWQRGQGHKRSNLLEGSSHSGTAGGKSYHARLATAETQAQTLSSAEWAHVAFVAADFVFASFVVFPEAMLNKFVMVVFGLAPGGIFALIAWRVLAPMRVVVLRRQRVDSVAFAGGALRGTLAVIMVKIVVLARCVIIQI